MAQNIVCTLIFAQHPAVSVYMDDPQAPARGHRAG
jgi:hypothetical protein